MKKDVLLQKIFLVTCSSIAIIFAIDSGLLFASREVKSKPRTVKPAKWQPHVNVNMKAGTKRHIGQIGFIAPLYQKEGRLLYADLRFMGDTKKAREGNFGLGHRWMINNDQQIAGVYGFFDRRQTEMGNNINQLTVGAELLSNTWDYRANVYLPQKKTKKVVLDQSETRKNDDFAGRNRSRVYDVTNKVKKEVPQAGFDLEVGRSMPGYDPLRIYGAYYHFQGRDGARSINGGRLRGQLAFNDHISLELEGSKDNARKDVGFIGLSFKIPLGGPENKPQLTALEKRMTEAPQRDIDIVATAVEQPVLVNTQKKIVKKLDDLGNEFNELSYHTTANPHASKDLSQPLGSIENPVYTGDPDEVDALSRSINSKHSKPSIRTYRDGVLLYKDSKAELGRLRAPAAPALHAGAVVVPVAPPPLPSSITIAASVVTPAAPKASVSLLNQIQGFKFKKVSASAAVTAQVAPSRSTPVSETPSSSVQTGHQNLAPSDFMTDESQEGEGGDGHVALLEKEVNAEAAQGSFSTAKARSRSSIPSQAVDEPDNKAKQNKGTSKKNRKQESQDTTAARLAAAKANAEEQRKRSAEAQDQIAREEAARLASAKANAEEQRRRSAETKKAVVATYQTAAKENAEEQRKRSAEAKNDAARKEDARLAERRAKVAAKKL